MIVLPSLEFFTALRIRVQLKNQSLKAFSPQKGTKDTKKYQSLNQIDDYRQVLTG